MNFFDKYKPSYDDQYIIVSELTFRTLCRIQGITEEETDELLKKIRASEKDRYKV